MPAGVFPDYELSDHTGKLRKLSELQGDDPLIVMLARGHYCPKEHQQHLELAAFYPPIVKAIPILVVNNAPGVGWGICKEPVHVHGPTRDLCLAYMRPFV